MSHALQIVTLEVTLQTFLRSPFLLKESRFQSLRIMKALLSDFQLVDIFSLHMCCLLRPCDLQALAQTCTTLRQLVRGCLSASTWESVAASSLPAAHPLRSLPGSKMLFHLERVARAKCGLPEPKIVSESTRRQLTVQKRQADTALGRRPFAPRELAVA